LFQEYFHNVLQITGLLGESGIQLRQLSDADRRAALGRKKCCQKSLTRVL
jgi:hypothetical protein